MDDERAAEVLFGNPGGDPGDIGNLETALGGTFDPLIHQVRMDGDHLLAKEIESEKSALRQGMTELGFSTGAAMEFGGILGKYFDHPRDAAAAQQELEETIDTLRTEWQEDFPQRLEDARRIVASIAGKSPRLAQFISSTGMKNSVALLRMAGGIAKHQPVAQAEKRGQEQAAAGRRSSNDQRRSSSSKIANALYGKKT